MSKPTIRSAFAVLLIAVVAPLWSAAAEAGVTVARVPDGGIQPQAATDSRGRVHLIYYKGNAAKGDVFYTRSDDGGDTFAPANRVNSQPGSAIALGTIRGAHLALGRGDRVHVAWNASEVAAPKLREGAMLYTRLTDTGDGFEPQRNLALVHNGLDGGGSVAADPDGNVYVAWHAPIPGGKSEADRRVWITRSRDDGATFEPEREAFGASTGACGCCGLRVFAAPGGAVFIAFRSATRQVHRDIHVLASRDHAETFKLVANSPWEVGHCVMSSTAFAGDGSGVLAAWETKEQILLGRFRPDGAAEGEPLPMPGDAVRRKHPAVAMNKNGEFVVAWTEGTGWNKGGSLAWQAFDASGTAVPGESGSVGGVPTWGLPAVFATPEGTFEVIY